MSISKQSNVQEIKTTAFKIKLTNLREQYNKDRIMTVGANDDQELNDSLRGKSSMSERGIYESNLKQNPGHSFSPLIIDSKL